MPLDAVGTFRAKAMQADLGRSSKKNTPQIAIRFQVTEGELAGEEIVAYLYLTDGAFDRAIESLRHCGWQGDSLDDLSTVGSKDCEIVVGEEEYQGKVYVRVKYINALGGGLRMAHTLSPSDKKAFAAQMRGRVITASQKLGKAAEKTVAAQAKTEKPAPSESSSDDDSIPF